MDTVNDDEQTHTNDLAHDDELFSRKDLERPRGVRIRGFSTPPVREGRFSEETPRLTRDDLVEACVRALKAPILSEHMAGKVLGRVLSAKPDDKGRIEVEVEMEDSPEGWAAINRVVQRKQIGFSWGARPEQTPDSKLNVAFTDNQPVELSLTDNPEFADDAIITHFPKKSKAHEAARKKVLDMLRTEHGRDYLGAPRYMGE